MEASDKKEAEATRMNTTRLSMPNLPKRHLIGYPSIFLTGLFAQYLEPVREVLSDIFVDPVARAEIADLKKTDSELRAAVEALIETVDEIGEEKEKKGF